MSFYSASKFALEKVFVSGDETNVKAFIFASLNLSMKLGCGYVDAERMAFSL